MARRRAGAGGAGVAALTGPREDEEEAEEEGEVEGAGEEGGEEKGA